MRPARALLSAARLPWFVEPTVQRPSLPQTTAKPASAPVLPEGVPQTLRILHSQLLASPHLDPDFCIVSNETHQTPGPPLPIISKRGTRRLRGGNFSGNDGFDIPGGIWSWIVLTQVKEGTESRGGIESVVRLIRKTLLTMNPPVQLPSNSKKKMQNGWALVDAGDFAVHVLSKDARLKYFGDREGSQIVTS